MLKYQQLGWIRFREFHEFESGKLIRIHHPDQNCINNYPWGSSTYVVLYDTRTWAQSCINYP